MTPADPTPSAAVAPTGGERMIPEHEVYGETGIVMLYHLALTEAAQNLIALGFKGGCDNEILSEALEAVEAHEPRAALSSPVRAEPTELRISDVDHNLLDDIRKYLDQLSAWAREQGLKVYAAEAAADVERLTLLIDRLTVSPPVRAERGEAERDAERWRKLVGCARLRIIGSGRDVMGVEFFNVHPTPTLPDCLAEFVAFVDALTPTPPATPTEPVYDKRGKAHGMEVTLDELPPELRAMVEKSRAARAATPTEPTDA